MTLQQYFLPLRCRQSLYIGSCSLLGCEDVNSHCSNVAGGGHNDVENSSTGEAKLIV